MHFYTSLLLGSGLVPLAISQYTLADDYSGDNFFNLMTFDTEDDPTHGYVNYVDHATAHSGGLVTTNNGVVTIKSDSSNVASDRGRNSVRVTSTKQYTHGLVVLDLEHMPGSACGIWPAFWMTGPNWPNNGEIDIIEGISYQSQNAMTMHTSGGCSMVSESCQGNQGCGVQAGGGNSFGDGFNNANGGVYAMEWTSNAINIWFFSRSNVPNGISGSAPDPSSWGKPTASFQGGSDCNIDDHFQNNNIVFDTTFCGDWAGNVWAQDPTCSSKAATCQEYVQNNPSAFSSAYWTINSLKVYTSGGSSTPAPVSSPTPSSSAAAAPIASSSPAPVASSSAAPVAVTTSTPPAQSPSPPASPPSSSGPVGIGSTTPGGPISENPVPPQNQVFGLGSTTPGGPLTENPIAARSLAEVLGGASANREEKTTPVGSGRVMRHLRRFHRHHHHRHQQQQVAGHS